MRRPHQIPLHRLRQAPICLCLAACALAQQAPVPYADGDGPTFAAYPDADTWPGSYQSIRKVDFSNLNNGEVALRNGHYERNEPDDHYSIDLDSVQYLGADAALVVYESLEVGGSSNSGGHAIVVTLSKGRLHSVQSIDWSTHSAGPRPTWSFEPKTHTLVIRSDHYRPGDAHCCISAVDVVTYRWNGALFVQTGLTTELLPQ